MPRLLSISIIYGRCWILNQGRDGKMQICSKSTQTMQGCVTLLHSLHGCVAHAQGALHPAVLALWVLSLYGNEALDQDLQGAHIGVTLCMRLSGALPMSATLVITRALLP